MQVRQSRPSDMTTLEALYTRAYTELLTPGYPPEVLAAALPKMCRAQPALVGLATYFAVERDGAVVGAGGWTPDRQISSLAHIRHVATDPRVVRKGVGRALFDRIFATAAASGMTQLECWSTLTAVGFYEALGFVSKGPIDVPMGEGIVLPSQRMERGV